MGGADDASRALTTVIGARQIVFSIWNTFRERKWVILGERRSAYGLRIEIAALSNG